MTLPFHGLLTSAESEREIHANIFGRPPVTDHLAKLVRVSKALEFLGNPQHQFRSIHVTGTNGKTSTSRMIASVLQAAGLKVGLFTSPHLSTMRERIIIDGMPLPQDDLVRLWFQTAPVINQVDADAQQDGDSRMSFFEVLTVLGFEAFRDAGVDVAIIEVGIGGSRDATIFADSEVAVLTPIALDHQNYFTGGVAGIAHEKSGVIKSGAAVVSANQLDEASEEILARATQQQASVFWESAHMSVEARQSVPGGQIASLRTAAATYPDVQLPLFGDFQCQNALLALSACELFLGNGVPRALEHDVVYRGLANTTSPGRMEVIAHSPLVMVDAAHNPHGVGALRSAFSEAFGDRRIVGLVAVLEDKDAAGVLAELEPWMDHIVVSQTDSPRCTPVEILQMQAQIIFGSERVTAVATLEQALHTAREIAGVSQEPEHEQAVVLVTGSITLISAVRDFVMQGVPEDFGGDLGETQRHVSA